MPVNAAAETEPSHQIINLYLRHCKTRAHRDVLVTSVCLSACLFTSPARSGGRHLRQPGANPREGDQLLPVYEPQGKARRQGETHFLHFFPVLKQKLKHKHKPCHFV